MAQWFKNKEMSLAIGLCISIPKVGSAINSLLSPLVVEKGGTVAESMMLGLVFLLFSYVILKMAYILGLALRAGVNLHGQGER